eukprot:10292218-Lingulodinium_polyedra.AAC.1
MWFPKNGNCGVGHRWPRVVGVEWLLTCKGVCACTQQTRSTEIAWRDPKDALSILHWYTNRGS